MTPVLSWTLRRERRAVLGWVVGIGLLVAVTTGSWPGIEQSSADFEQVLQNLPDALTAFFGEGIADFSAAGIIGSRLYGTIGLATVIAYAVSRGSRAIAGEEEQGTLELLVTQPVSRSAVAGDRLLAMLVGLTGLVAVEMGLLMVAMPLVGLDFPVPTVVGASVGLLVLAAMFGSVAFAVGAATGRRGVAVATAGGGAGALFVLTGLSGLVDGLGWVRDVSPFGVYDGTRVLAEGLDVPAALVMVLVAGLATAAGIAAFRGRDLS